MDIKNEDREIFLGWAKVNVDKNLKNNKFHSVIYHLLDAGACAQEILKREPSLVELITPFLKPVYSKKLIKNILSFFVAMHDLGKLSPGFQALLGAKNISHNSIQQWKPYEKYWNGISRNFSEKDKICHGYISGYSLLNYFFKLNSNLKENSFPVRFTIAIGQHHDKNQTLQSCENWPGVDYYHVDKNYRGGESWEKLREKMIVVIWEIIIGKELTLEKFLADFGGNFELPSVHYEVLFAGLACSADWIASNEKFFKYENTVQDICGIQEYFSERKILAKKVLEGKIFWGNQNSQHFISSTFKDIFEFSPRSYQNDVLEIVKNVNSPSLTILEAPMGMGKTEAALSFLMAPFSKTSRGLYFALPTQATSNQMYERVNKILNSFFQNKNSPVQLQILHGNKKWNDLNAELFFDSEESSLFDEIKQVYDQDMDESFLFQEEIKGTLASSWHQSSRTGLLAEFGVGTIDQILRCALIHEKHYFVKHFGLAGKTIILDEIHAYDAYMDKAICRVLEWLAYHGCHVILMSATLPKEKRENFLEVFCDSKIETSEKGFPRISSVSFQNKNSFQEVVSNTLEMKSKKTPVKFLEISDYHSLVEHVLKDVQQSASGIKKGVIGIVCNTVKTSQEVYKAFENYGFNKEDILLFNARFSMEIRKEKEEYIKNSFGKVEFKKHLKQLKNKRPQFKIVIATQVIEQSLDIDFDFMYSFLCPIDLLLQRMGRHYRRCRWDLNSNIEFTPTPFGIIHDTCDSSGLPLLELCAGTKRVYYECLLLKTFVVLKEFLQKNNEIIDDVFDLEDLIQNVYGENQIAMEFARIKNSFAKMGLQNKVDEKKAESGLHYSPQGYENLEKKYRENWFLEVTKLRKTSYTFSSQTRLFDDSKQILIFIVMNGKKYSLNAENELNILPDFHSLNRNDVKKIIGTLVTMPGYMFKKIPIEELKNSKNEFKDSKILRYYEAINLIWNGEYASQKFENTEIRYCAHYGLQIIN